jgi:PAS domain S-box-containing protein
LVSKEGIIVDANQQLEEMLGYNHSEFLSLKVIDLVAPQLRELIQSSLKSGAEGPYECLIVKKDGSFLPVEIRAKNVSLKGQIERVCAIRDISERKKAEELLKSSQEELKAIVFYAPLGIATSNSNMLFLSANEAFCRITGYSEDELQKRTFREITLKGAIHNNKMERMNGEIRDREKSMKHPS